MYSNSEFGFPTIFLHKILFSEDSPLTSSIIGDTYRLKSPILNDGVDDLLVGHQSPALREVVLCVLLRHTTHAANIWCKYLVKMFSENI